MWRCQDRELQKPAGALLGQGLEQTDDRRAALDLASLRPPAAQVTLKVAYALAAGCTTVLKPSEYAPLSASLFAEAVDAAGFPRGVFNMVHGRCGGRAPAPGRCAARARPPAPRGRTTAGHSIAQLV